MTRHMIVIAAVVFGLLMPGFAQHAAAQSTSTAAVDVPAVKELYGMKLVRSVTAAREIWVNSNSFPVTAVWDLRRKNGERAGQLRQVFKAKEQREVNFAADVATVIIMAYKDETDRMIQGNSAANWTYQTPDVPQSEGGMP